MHSPEVIFVTPDEIKITSDKKYFSPYRILVVIASLFTPYIPVGLGSSFVNAIILPKSFHCSVFLYASTETAGT